ncbi:chorismate lyase [Moraxella canis]|uniref:Chorismate lyase n=1 Tax=Moraxella canis TaxID=90239 RepID=A0ABZ0WZQ3_9GAMM|nr:chorismate lyase [Moraxella canis]WQE04676.1 chorismate lyase [Moraxella canis]
MPMDEIFDHHSPRLASFVLAQGSLTALLEAQSGKPLKVEILHQGYQPLTFAQKSQLGLPPNRLQVAWVRSVKLYGDGSDAWVLAKSIFPLASLTGSLARLKALGTTPIGYVLFKKRRQLPIERHFYRCDNQIGRQTVYDIDGRKILIDELFLAAFEASLDQ